MFAQKHILASVISFLYFFPPLQLFSQTPIYFYNVGDQTGTKFHRNCHGSGFFDYNNDGYDDVFIVHNVSISPQGPKPHVLLKNLGDGTFVNVASQAGVEGYNTSAQGLAAGDYNNDGYPDIAIGMGGKYYRMVLYKNNGDGTFTDVSSAAKVTSYNRGRSLVFVDYNNDGYLDLFVFGDSASAYVYSLLVYKNNGDGTFSIASKETGLRHKRSSKDLYGVAFADVDNDGDMDFFVPNYDYGSHLFINNGDGTFTESINSGLPRSNGLKGAIFLDYNNDGWFDLFVRRAWDTCLLFRNNHDGTFTNVTYSAGLGVKSSDAPYGGGLSVADFDNDGYVDILAICEAHGRNNKLFHNNGDGTFTDIAKSANLTRDIVYWSAPIADYDHDGYLDIYFARNGHTKPDGTVDYYATLFRNAGGTNNWLHVKLVGVQSNRSAIGSRLVAYTDGKLQMRQVLGGGGYKTDSFPAEFGLAHATEVDSLIIYWPSGIIQKIFKIMANQRITITEQEGSFYYGPFSLSGHIHYYNNEEVPKVQINMSGDEVRSSTANDSGTYTFSNIMGEEAITITPTKPKGEDINPGTLSAYDAALTARCAVGLETLTEDQKKAADVDENGMVDITDAASIARAATGLSDIAGSHVGEWRFMPDSREYPRMIDNYDNGDFAAMILGDVSGNWASPSGMNKLRGLSVSLSDSVSMVVNPMDTIYIPLISEKGIDLISSDLWLRYDTNVLKFLGTSTSQSSSNFNVICNDSKAGFVKIAMYGTHPISGANTFLTIKFQVIGNANQETTIINWDRYQLNDRLYNKPPVHISVIETGVETAVPMDFHLEDNFPNPFNSGTTISYQLGTSGKVSLVIYDVMGRRIRTLVNGIQSQGRYQVKWDGKNDEREDVPSGIYICQLRAGGRSWVLKMAKTK